MKSGRVGAIHLLMILLFTILFGYGPRAIPPGDPNITLDLVPAEKDVELEPGKGASVNFTLSVSCQVVENRTVILNLTAKADWWEVSPIPPLNFTRDNRASSVNITVEVPANMSATDRYQLEVWGSWEYANGSGFGSVEKISSVIDVLPFYDLYLGSNHPEIVADVGDWTEFIINITNKANIAANVTLSVEKDSDKIVYDLENDQLYLDKGETRTVVIKVRQEPSRSRRNNIVIRAKFEKDPEQKEFKESLVLKTEPKYTTLFYERSFIYLMGVLTVITLVAVGLYIYEKVVGKKDEEEPKP